jgi:hypothetical protein
MNVLEEFGFDVCGYGAPAKFLPSHLHIDHLVFANNVLLYVPKPIVDAVRRIYLKRGLKPEILPLTTYKPVKDDFWNPHTMRYEVGTNYISALEEHGLVFIPECRDAELFVSEYAASYEIVVVSRIPRIHGKTLKPEDLPPNTYLADNTILGMVMGSRELQVLRKKRVIPKCAPSLLDARKWGETPPRWALRVLEIYGTKQMFNK